VRSKFKIEDLKLRLRQWKLKVDLPPSLARHHFVAGRLPLPLTVPF